MNVQIRRSDFEKIYEDSYEQTLRFAIVKCKNIEDINDIVQDTYLELLKIIKKKKVLEIENINSYVCGIENNIIKRHYHKKPKDTLSFYNENDNIIELEIKDSFNLEENIINKSNIEKVWKYLKQKDLVTKKIFYLYFALGLKISDISKELEIGESQM